MSKEAKALVSKVVEAGKDIANELFYYSLFDPSSWEEDLYGHEVEVEREILKIIRKIDPKFCRRLKDEKKSRFFHNFVYNGSLCATMIETRLAKGGIKTRASTKGFPDLVSIVEDNQIGIEIKRLTVCSDPTRRIEDEVLSKLTEWKGSLILLLIFPQIGEEENPRRIQMFIDGYYFLDHLINEKTGFPASALPCYITRAYQHEYSFDGLIERVIDKIYELDKKYKSRAREDMK